MRERDTLLMSSTFRFFVLRTLFIAILISSSAGCSGDRRIHKLFKAIDAGDATTVDAVLDDETFDLKATSDSGATFLFHAMAAHNKPIYVKLLEKGASPNHCDSSGSCIMNEAATQADSYWLSEALAHGGDVDAPNTGNRHAPNRTPLFYALDARRAETTKVLIDAGANVNHQDDLVLAPLRVAGGNGMYESIAELLEAGANPTQKDKHGHDFIDWFKTQVEIEISAEIKDQLPWFRKVREILLERGLISPESTK